VSDVERIVRLAARGDGVTEGGRFVAMTAPGDLIAPDGAITPGPHHQLPPCRHFPECGGCQLQHVDDAAYAVYLKDRIAAALAAQGVAAPDIRAPHLSPPRSRRRAALKAAGGIVGFNEAASHRIVDMRECHILRGELFALVAPLRRLLTGRASAAMTLADQGVDLLLEGIASDTLEAAEAMTEFARGNGLARLALDDGFGPQTIWEPEPVTITLSGVPVALPHGAFLQATAEGEAALVAAVREAVAGAGVAADLFAGLGTFALALAGKVYAAEGARDAALALKAAGRGLFVDHRDLFRRPLEIGELNRFEAVVLDPPRAGAKEQIPLLAASNVPRIAYVSCNPATFARDARILIGGGYRLAWVRPVGQFRWSTHVELAAAFEK
jgi:23S rRNA (uracil1939-C5)-methyltransferase